MTEVVVAEARLLDLAARALAAGGMRAAIP